MSRLVFGNRILFATPKPTARRVPSMHARFKGFSPFRGSMRGSMRDSMRGSMRGFMRGFIASLHHAHAVRRALIRFRCRGWYSVTESCLRNAGLAC